MKHNSKRRFLRQMGLVAAGSVCAPYQLFPNLDHSYLKGQANRKLGVALVGLGYYSRDLLAPALQLTKHCELKGIVTGTPSKIPIWQKRYGIKDRSVYNYGNMHEIANNDEIDVIYIVVPTGLHMKYSVIAANTGKHIWCEKPMAMNVDECEAIISACEKNKVKLSIGYRVQHEPNMQEIISLTKRSIFGKVEKVTAAAGYSGGVGEGWRFQKNLGGGALYDMGVYTINGIRHASQMEPIAVTQAKHTTDRPKYFHEVDETTTYTLEFENGTMAEGKTSVGINYNRLEVICESGSYHLSPMQSYNGLKGSRSDGVAIYTPIENQQALQMDNDALAIINNKNVLVPGIDGLRDIRIVNAIQRSAKSGRRELI